MKTFKLIGMTLLMAIFAVNFTACSDDDPVPEKPEVPEVPDKPNVPENPTPVVTLPDGATDFFKKGMNFETKGGEQSLVFETNVDWTISVAETRGNTSWCTVSPTSGKAGKNTVKVSATANDSFDNRSVVLTLQTGDLKSNVTVTQKQKDALTLTADKFEVGNEGGSIEVEVKANVQFEVEIAENAKDWITPTSKSRGLTASVVTFDVAAYNDTKARQGDIIIKSGKLSETIHVFQAGKEKSILLSKNNYSVSPNGETIEVTVKSNFEYGVQMPAVDWIVETKDARAMSSHTLYFNIKPNKSDKSRSAEIIFFDKDSDLKTVLTVNQGGKPATNKKLVAYRLDYLDGDFQSITFEYDAKGRLITSETLYKGALHSKIYKYTWYEDKIVAEYLNTNTKATYFLKDGVIVSTQHTGLDEVKSRTMTYNPDLTLRQCDIYLDHTSTIYTFMYEWKDGKMVTNKDLQYDETYHYTYGDQTCTGFLPYFINTFITAESDNLLLAHPELVGLSTSALPTGWNAPEVGKGTFSYTFDNEGYIKSFEEEYDIDDGGLYHGKERYTLTWE